VDVAQLYHAVIVQFSNFSGVTGSRYVNMRWGHLA